MSVRRTLGATSLLSSLIFFAVSCASSPPPAKTQSREEAWPEAKRTDYEHADDPCKEKDGSSKPCETDNDCCKGYTCGHDPDRSRVQHFCVGG